MQSLSKTDSDTDENSDLFKDEYILDKKRHILQLSEVHFSWKLPKKDFSHESENEENFLINLNWNHANSSHGKNKKKKRRQLSKSKVRAFSQNEEQTRIEHYGKFLLMLLLQEGYSNIKVLREIPRRVQYN